MADRSVDEYMEDVMKAEASGIPVDWKNVAIKLYQAMSNPQPQPAHTDPSAHPGEPAEPSPSPAS